jgi:uncharacterized repeat protein (TIGR01451 family)
MNTLLFLAASLTAGAPPSPPSAFSQTMHVQVVGPAGLRTTWRPGTPAARAVDGAVGLRPGYIHRAQLTGYADEPNTVFDISIEVRETLFMPVTLNPADFPATIPVSADDLKRVLAGGMITKVIYLEDPLTAAPESTTPDQPLEREAARGETAFETAKRHGRPMLIARLGSRSLSAEELIGVDIAGTLQYPGEPLAPPAHPPILQGKHFQWWDPTLGPKIPTEELLPDGGDIGPRMGIGPDGHLGNLDATDTGIEYRAGGKRRAAISNRVCLFAPRFPVIREELLPAGYGVVLPVGLAAQAAGPGLNRKTLPPLVANGATNPALVRKTEQPHATIVRVALHELESFQGGPLVLGTVEGLLVKATVIEPLTLIQYRDQCKPSDPLVLIKTLDPREAKPGDIVTFTIKYVNYGGKPAENIIVADSLASRLEYVPGSSRGDRPTTFTMQANEAGSAVLRWQVAGDLPPGQSGIVQFQAKVR